MPPSGFVTRGLDCIFGTHPAHHYSFVSAVGNRSKHLAYGNNRADFAFIAGGVVPGVLVLKPDYPENMDDWPFLWGENEYMIGIGASYSFSPTPRTSCSAGSTAHRRVEPAWRPRMNHGLPALTSSFLCLAPRFFR